MLGWGKKKPENAPVQAGHSSGTPAHSAQSGPASSHAASAPPRPKITRTLGEILVGEGVITEGQRKEALTLQATSGDRSLVQILIEKGYLHGNLLSSFLAKRFGLPHVSLVDCLVSNELFQLVPKDLCRRYSVIPLDRMGTTITLAMVNPLDQEALDAVKKLNPELRIKSILCDWNGFKSVADRVLESDETKPVDLTASSLGLSVPKTSTPVTSPPPPAPQSTAAPATPAPVEPPAQTPQSPPDPVREDTKEWNHLVGYAERTMSPTAHSAAPAAAAHTPSSNLDAVMLSSKYETYAVLARRLVLFQGLDPMDVATVFDSGMMIEAAPGQVLFEKGATEKDLYVILSGEVAIRDGNRDLAKLGSGEMFGEMALVGDAPRSASAVVTNAASLFVLNEEKFRVLLSSKISIRMLLNIVVTLSERLREANRHAVPPAV